MAAGMANGSRRERFALVAAVHLFLLDGERVLLSLRHNTGYADGQWSTVAGHLDGDETAVAAMRREAREEAGIALAPEDLAVVGIMHSRAESAADREYCHFFLAARAWVGTPTNLEPEKCATLAWHSLDALPPNVVPYVRRALANYRRGLWFDSFGWEGVEDASPATPPR
jgi:8-oxo-dGTP pyrophosphatase MutT (NUDIX family)